VYCCIAIVGFGNITFFPFCKQQFCRVIAILQHCRFSHICTTAPLKRKPIFYYIITVFTVFRLLTDFVCLYTYEFWLSLCKIVRSSVILLLPLLVMSLYNDVGCRLVFLSELFTVCILNLIDKWTYCNCLPWHATSLHFTWHSKIMLYFYFPIIKPRNMYVNQLF